MLWVGLLGGIVAWSFQLLVGYGMTEAACPGSLLVEPVEALGGLTVVLTTISVIAAFGAIASGWAAFTLWRAPDRPQRDRGLAFVGLLLDGLFLGVIVLTATGPLFVPGCT